MTIDSASQARREGRADFISTYLTEGLIVLVGLLVYRVVAARMGSDGFAEYQIARSAIALLLPLQALGLWVALPKYLARSGNDRGARYSYDATAIGMALISTAVAAGVFTLSGSRTASLVFGRSGFEDHLFGVILVSTGQVFDTISYAGFRGRLAFRQANGLRLITQVVLPAVVALTADNVPSLLVRQGTALLGVSMVVLIARRVVAQDPAMRVATDLVSFSLRRQVGEVGNAALIALPALLAANRGSLEQAGFVAFGISVVLLIGGSFSPVGLVLLPRLANSQMDPERTIRLLTRVTLLISVTVTVLVFIWFESLVRIYLGIDLSSGTERARFVLIGSIPYALFLVHRGTVDALFDRALNTRNVTVALGVLLATIPVADRFLGGLESVTFSFLLALLALSALTLSTLRGAGGDRRDRSGAVKAIVERFRA